MNGSIKPALKIDVKVFLLVVLVFAAFRFSLRSSLAQRD